MMLVAIVNHECNDGAVALVNGFRPYADVVAIDSGSNLEEQHDGIFDLKLPNVYYSGLLNVAYEEMRRRPAHGVLYFICSDVRIDDFAAALAYAEEAFQDPRTGVYAPSANTSAHLQMLCKHTETLRPAVFVEGFCFATRVSLLQKLCPVDTHVNRLGHGLDIYLGFLALQAGLRCVIDDRITVVHPGESGYDQPEARRQRHAWIARQGGAAKRFHRLAGWTPCKTRFGLRVIQGLHRIGII